ncbi:MAG: hypothetical protein R3350_09750 [Saprospiraceae bacterium]|nr:hypothetical protein [Saprospiraceae bacterium]
MKKIQTISIFIAAVLLIAGVYLLASDSRLLTVEIGGEGGYPMGNLVAWSVFILFPVIFYLGLRRDLLLRARLGQRASWLGLNLLRLCLILGLIWGVVSYFLAGNWQYIFSSNPTGLTIWAIYSALIVALPFFVWLVFLLGRLIWYLRHMRKT